MNDRPTHGLTIPQAPFGTRDPGRVRQACGGLDFNATDTSRPLDDLDAAVERADAALRAKYQPKPAASMTLAEFSNALRLLHNIDADELRGVSPEQARAFIWNPVRTFMRADDAMAAAIWAAMERRMEVVR